jgi:hypothetical protein
MTPGERALWLAVFGASWRQSTGGPMGLVTDEHRVMFCLAQADRAVAAVRAADVSVSENAEEVLE